VTQWQLLRLGETEAKNKFGGLQKSKNLTLSLTNVVLQFGHRTVN
jgi:hypothetical protein